MEKWFENRSAWYGGYLVSFSTLYEDVRGTQSDSAFKDWDVSHKANNRCVRIAKNGGQTVLYRRCGKDEGNEIYRQIKAAYRNGSFEAWIAENGGVR